ncbi:hypothetical protein HZ992_03345 [Rhizobacter sp. AJA081-3]|uniref:hypothetical protein n=1 Tax=Rhizobacter sp. AJA081-3 TaxID=2753607 RepID=UPI001ADF4234|nr:hypothetical protein [Rhizobacter sp. AJA081-3]QTN24053.1 hypothetical protein HZ992_03345 [Rhizobacter sp. AJA081-3]
MNGGKPLLAPCAPEGVGGPRAWWREAMARQPELTVFALLLWAAMLPLLALHGLDDRSLRGVGVWVKPLKFLASTGLFALTTAWFVGLLPAGRRRDGNVLVVVWTVIVASLLENGYIGWQAARGEASHYNFSDAWHIAAYSAMGAVAMALAATQLLLAWQILRHGRDDVDPFWRRAVLTALILTFVLGAGAGGTLGSMQPPANAGLPLFGWHLAGGDLRPAHFIGLHAQQLVPLAALAMAAWPRRQRAMTLFVAAYVLLWAAAMALGLHGARLTVPYGPAA